MSTTYKTNPDGKITIRLYERAELPAFATGGLAQAAEAVRGRGRMGDDILIHVNPDEFKQMQELWGEPTINPHTGLPEYGFFSKLWKKIKKVAKVVLPIALNFIPGVGTALSAGLSAMGVGASALPAVTAAVKGALSGAMSGGSKGALIGAVTGGLGATGAGGKLGSAVGLSGKTADMVGNAVIAGGANAATGGDFAQGALGSAADSLVMPYINKAVAGSIERMGLGDGAAGGGNTGSMNVPSFGMDTGFSNYDTTTSSVPYTHNSTPSGYSGLSGLTAPTSSGSMSDVMGGASLSSILNGSGASSAPASASSSVPYTQNGAPVVAAPEAPAASSGSGLNPLLVAGGLAALAGSGGAGSSQSGAPPELPSNFTTPLQQLQLQRQRLANPTNYYTYGMSPQGEHAFYGPTTYTPFQNQQPTTPTPDLSTIMQGVPGFASGGLGRSAHFVSSGAGSGGRKDDIPALLSENEYVVDAETLALLGDGSPEAGAKKLDAFRANVRKHKGSALARGKISPNAKPSVESYMKKAAR
jgi:hypothetical protein